MTPATQGSPADPGRTPGASLPIGNLVGATLGNYRLERLLGRGQMGVVYLALDQALLRPTAVKVLAWAAPAAGGLDPVEWFLTEARMVARMSDPHVVQIYGAARQGDLYYIAMEYVEGTSAETAITSGQRLTPERATEVLQQVCSALHAAHECAIVHRDVKPGNILLGAGGIAKLSDFGMAHGSAAASASVRAGTPYYTAPELWRGSVALPASDVYSLGATYFHLLTGRPPFDGPDLAAIAEAHQHAPIPDPREFVAGIPSSCADLVRRALAKTPEQRHTSARLLEWDGRRVLGDLIAGKQPRPPKPQRRVEPMRSSSVLSLRPAVGPLADFLGFVQRPFSPAPSSWWPFQEEPVASTWTAAREWLRGEDPILVISGGPGSGRSATCLRLAEEAGAAGSPIRVDLGADEERRSLARRVARAAGCADAARDDLDAFLHRCATLQRESGSPPLVVLDGGTPASPDKAGLLGLLGAAAWTRSFRVVLTGAPGLAATLAREADLRGVPLPEIALPRLGRAQVFRYLQAWIEACRPPGAPAILLSPDALGLLALRSEGGLARINLLAANMLLLAASERRRVVTSWDAWAASDREDWSEGSAASMLPRRPASWPHPEALATLDALRRSVGAPPWPVRARPNTNPGDLRWRT